MRRLSDGSDIQWNMFSLIGHWLDIILHFLVLYMILFLSKYFWLFLYYVQFPPFAMQRGSHTLCVVQVSDNLLHDASSNQETLIFCSQTLRSKVICLSYSSLISTICYCCVLRLTFKYVFLYLKLVQVLNQVLAHQNSCLFGTPLSHTHKWRTFIFFTHNDAIGKVWRQTQFVPKVG